MEKKMAAAAGAESINMPKVTEAPGGNEHMPVINIAVPQHGVNALEKDVLEQKNDIFSIRELPDYRHVDSSGFLTDVWNAFKDDTKRIWRERNTIAEKR
jgi:hypothetical protein